MICEQVGDVITCTSRPEGGWWKGILRGREGVFPDNFVKVRNVTRCQKWKLGTPTKEFVKAVKILDVKQALISIRNPDTTCIY